MMKLFKSKTPAPVAYVEAPAAPSNVYEVVVTAKPQSDMLKEWGFRTGMWTMTPSGVGVLVSCDESRVYVNLAKPDGSNKMKLDENDVPVVDRVGYEPHEIRQAFIEEIPESRKNDHAILAQHNYRNAV